MNKRLRLQYKIEAALLIALFTAFRQMPLDLSSAAGGFIARSIGPFLGAHRTARRNLDKAYPKMKSGEKHKILIRMWDNLGRVAGELPHLPGKDLVSRVKISGMEHLPPVGQQAMFVSGHIANWELLPSMGFDNGFPITVVYRKANNPYVDRIITKLRASHCTNSFPKGPAGSVRMLRALKNGDSLSMLVDQKMNDGIAVPFFGRPAMTAPAIAQIALRYDLPIIFCRMVRTKGAHFEGSILPPLEYKKTGDEEKDILHIMTLINLKLENWIREHPEQWFWVHNRWPNDAA